MYNYIYIYIRQPSQFLAQVVRAVRHVVDARGQVLQLVRHVGLLALDYEYVYVYVYVSRSARHERTNAIAALARHVPEARTERARDARQHS